MHPMQDIYSFLSQHAIPYEKCDHPPVFTCEESDRLVPHLPGARTKNLFLRDDKGKRYFLVVVECAKSADLKALKQLIGVSKLSFGSPEKLKEMLGVEPGAVTMLGLIADTKGEVEVFLDTEIWEADFLQCHPLVNTASLVVSHEGIEKFLKASNHAWNVIDVPARIVM